jgi:16S rRNA (uracil1498-N3)-methyltransferase
MQFIYDKNSSQKQLFIRDENYRYLFRVRRSKVGDIVSFRNLEDDFLYRYKIVIIKKKEAELELIGSKKDQQKSHKNFHLMWCIIDPKTIYGTLPMLNQLGVSKITFLYCDRSQKNFKLDHSKIEKILINSSQQCGRVKLMNIEILDSLEDLLKLYSDFLVLDFGGEKEWGEADAVLVGCEGGFSEDEREKLQNHRKIGFDTDLILKSETAALTIVSKLLI